LSTPFFKKI